MDTRIKVVRIRRQSSYVKNMNLKQYGENFIKNVTFHSE